MSEHKPYKPRFRRKDYLDHAWEFENGKIDEAQEELTEFNDDPEDLAFELAYTRYYLARAEKELSDNQQESDDA